MSKNLPGAPPLPPGLSAVGSIEPLDWDQPHVGNLWAVKKMLMGLLDTDEAAMIAYAEARASWEDANGSTVAHIQRLAAAFLGRDADVQHLPGWNAPGGIDAHLRRQFPLVDGTPEKAVEDVLAKLVAFGRGLMDIEDSDEDVGAAKLKAAVEIFAGALTGHPQGSTEMPWPPST